MHVARKQTRAAATALGATTTDAGRIELAVGEALSNARDHGYDGTPGPVNLEIAYADNRFAVTINDVGTGLPFEPHFPDPPNPQMSKGYGLQVIKELMDEAELEHSEPKGRGTTIRMAMTLR